MGAVALYRVGRSTVGETSEDFSCLQVNRIRGATQCDSVTVILNYTI